MDSPPLPSGRHLSWDDDAARSAIRVEDKLVKLAPGMAVTAEIKTGRWRVIEYFLSPLLQDRDESLRER